MWYAQRQQYSNTGCYIIRNVVQFGSSMSSQQNTTHDSWSRWLIGYLVVIVCCHVMSSMQLHLPHFSPARSTMFTPQQLMPPFPAYTDVLTSITFLSFSSIMAADVEMLIRQLPDNALAADPIPMSVLKDTVDLVAPYIKALFNRSFATGCFQTCLNTHSLCPLSKRQAWILWRLVLIGHFQSTRPF